MTLWAHSFSLQCCTSLVLTRKNLVKATNPVIEFWVNQHWALHLAHWQTYRATVVYCRKILQALSSQTTIYVFDTFLIFSSDKLNTGWQLSCKDAFFGQSAWLICIEAYTNHAISSFGEYHKSLSMENLIGQVFKLRQYFSYGIWVKCNPVLIQTLFCNKIVYAYFW